MFILDSNEPIKVAYLQKSANQSMLNGALVIDMVNHSFRKKQEKLLPFDKARNNLIEKIEIRAVKNIFPLDFAKYLSYSELQKNRREFVVYLLQKRSMGTSFW